MSDFHLSSELLKSFVQFFHKGVTEQNVLFVVPLLCGVLPFFFDGLGSRGSPHKWCVNRAYP